MTMTLERPRTTTTSRGFLAWLALAGLVCVSMAFFAASAYVTLDIDASRAQVRGPLHFGLLVVHVFTGTVALAVGVFQFWPWLRNKYPAVHRTVGRTYFFAGVFPSAVFGFAVATMSLMGLPVIIPLGLLAILWLTTGVKAFNAARARKFGEHRKWMIRNFALTTAAVTGRLWALLLLGIVTPFEETLFGDNGDLFLHDVIGAANWLSIVVNLLVAEWYLQRRHGK